MIHLLERVIDGIYQHGNLDWVRDRGLIEEIEEVIEDAPDCMKNTEENRYGRHRKVARKCPFLDRRPSSDWVTCTHTDNPTAIQICSDEHCPIYDNGRVIMEKQNG